MNTFEDSWKGTMGDMVARETPEVLALKKLAHVFYCAGELSATTRIMQSAIEQSRARLPADTKQ